MANYINYILMVIGTFIIFISLIMIYLDRLKGEDIYFNIDVKEQQIKKVMEDAEEIITELNYTSEVVVKEIEAKINELKESYKNIDKYAAKSPAAEDSAPSQIQGTVLRKKTTAPAAKKNKLVAEKPEDNKSVGSKLTPKQKAVFDYAEQGMSVTDIAKEMKIGQGEVLLILSLNNEV